MKENYCIVFYPYFNNQKRGACEMCKAILISEVIINTCIEKSYPLNTSKLQKILYFMQKEHLKKYNEPIFSEKIVAWDCGPAIQEIDRYFQMGRLEFRDKVEQSTILLESHQKILDVVLDDYGNLDPLEMMTLSQQEKSWITVWNKGAGKNQEIPVQLISTN